MKDKYDFIYLTNTPSFYKLNLCNEIANTKSTLLVFYGYGSEAVNIVLQDKLNFKFDYIFLNKGSSNKRNKLRTFVALLGLMSKLKYKKVLYSGWISLEYNLFALLSPKEKNVVVCESAIWNVSFSGTIGWIKRIIINRMGAALPSGQPHKELFISLNFKGKVNITGSVGIFNKGIRRQSVPNDPLRYIFVGRLISVKNISLLIDEFNSNGKPLTVVGAGELEKQLKQQAKDNISFIGFIDNEKLGEVYQSHDVFILPSYSETWGLVVEEAIYWGIPVIVSSCVGSSIDMVQNLGTGEIFKSNDCDSLHRAIEMVECNYEKYKAAVDAIDWNERDQRQVAAYLDLLK